MNVELDKHFSVKHWTVITFFGWLFGVMFILLLSSFLHSIGIEHLQFYLGVGIGTGVGLAQWHYLKKIAPIHTDWIWCSVAGMGIPFILLDLIQTEPSAYKLPLSVALGALMCGTLQYMILKKYSTGASVWIWGCFIGWIAAVIMINLTEYITRINVSGSMNLVLAFINLVLILAGGIVLGIISGNALKKIFELRITP